MKNKKFLISLFVLPLILSGCGSNTPSATSSSEPGSTQSTSSDSSTSSSQSVDPDKASAYEKSLTWGQSGHIYMHYLRPSAKDKSDYDDWGIWLWPNAPQDLEGTMWGAVNTASKATIPYPMTETRMTNIGGTGKDVDDFGVIYDIDLTRKDIKGGKSGNPVSFDGCTKAGFLVAKLSSMDGKTHWTSDGGANLYIEKFQTHWREDGTMHLFLTQGDCANYTFTAGGVVEVNPTIEDKEGKYRSEEKRISDKYAGQVPATSNSFKKLGVGYQIFVASFRDSDGNGMGDIQGIIDALPYLKKLNVQCIWLTPVFKCESYHGYDTVDYYQIDERFGDMETFENLLAKAKEAGMKVILDLVLNHTSKNHVWYRNSQKAAVSKDEALGKEVAWRNIYHWKFKGDKVQFYDHTQNKYKTINVEDHPDWYKDGESDYYYYGKFGSGMPELNYDNQQTRDLVIALGNYWLKKGVSGFRLDAVKHIYMKDEVENSGNDVIVADIGSKSSFDDQLKKFVNKSFDYSSDVTRNVEFWKEFSAGLKKTNKDCFLVGENFDGYGARIAPYYQAMDSQFDFSNFFHIDEWVYQRKESKTPEGYSSAQYSDSYAYYKSNSDNSTIYGNGGAVTHRGNYPTGHRNDFINGAFTSNHDTLRAINHVNSSSLKTVELKDKNNKVIKDDKGNTITFTTSKVSNTATEIGKAKVAAAMTVLNGGLSWIYYGDEIGMTSNTDTHIELYGNPNNEDLWYRQPFKWDAGTGKDTVVPKYQFNGYTVEWDSANKNLANVSSQENNNKSMLSFYRQLCALKVKFGNAQFGAVSNWNKSGVVHWMVGSYHVYINTTGNVINGLSATGTAQGYASSNGTACNTSTLQPYSALVTK